MSQAYVFQVLKDLPTHLLHLVFAAETDALVHLLTHTEPEYHELVLRAQLSRETPVDAKLSASQLQGLHIMHNGSLVLRTLSSLQRCSDEEVLCAIRSRVFRGMQTLTNLTSLELEYPWCHNNQEAHVNCLFRLTSLNRLQVDGVDKYFMNGILTACTNLYWTLFEFFHPFHF